MKRLVVVFAAVCCMAIVTIAASPKNAVNALSQNSMHMVKNMPDGRGRFALEADHIDTEWTTGIDHFKGNVRAEIQAAGKDEWTAMILHADALDYNSQTGEFSSTGNARFVLEAPHKR
jgi:lipopolysaccharide assembly outer membrane protein LptD (OstA)